MSFAIKRNIEKLQEKSLSGTQREAAVDCWFTATGRGMPRLVKMKDDAGALLTLENIRVLKTEQKFYGGILARKCWCETVADDYKIEFILLFYPEENRWKVML